SSRRRRYGRPRRGHTMKKALIAIVTLVSACGGSGNGSASTAALDKTFTYGAPQAPTASEQSAAVSAQSSVSQASSFAASPNAASASAIISIAEELSFEALGTTPVGARLAPEHRR